MGPRSRGEQSSLAGSDPIENERDTARHHEHQKNRSDNPIESDECRSPFCKRRHLSRCPLRQFERSSDRCRYRSGRIDLFRTEGTRVSVGFGWLVIESRFRFEPSRSLGKRLNPAQDAFLESISHGKHRRSGSVANLLVVDDNNDLVEGLSDLLRSEGHKVHTASTGEEGLRVLRAAPLPDALLLDIDMPVLNGPGMLRNVAGAENIRPGMR